MYDLFNQIVLPMVCKGYAAETEMVGSGLYSRVQFSTFPQNKKAPLLSENRRGAALSPLW